MMIHSKFILCFYFLSFIAILKMNSFDTSDAEFQRQSQFISSSVQKIYQNGA